MKLFEVPMNKECTQASAENGRSDGNKQNPLREKFQSRQQRNDKTRHATAAKNRPD